jgi:hypothetical protein
VHHALALATPVDDLEAIAFDARPGVGRLLAVASHRRQDEPAETVIVRRALAAVAREEALRIPPAAIAAALARAGVDVATDERGRTRVDGRPWWKRREEGPEYALEIEAAACLGDELLLGLKRPRTPDGGALVLALALDELCELGEPAQAVRALRLDLGGFGATAMCVDPSTGELLVASNPGSGPGDGGESASGRSLVHRFRRAGDEFTPVAEPVALGRADARLEGLAIVDDEAWLAYDGDAPALVRRPRWR